MKKLTLVLSIAALIVLSGLGLAFQRPSFAGDWTMDRARSFGLPATMNQAMKVAQNGEQIDLETRIINPDGENTIKDSYTIDGKQHDFTPQGAKGPIPNSKGKRTANWLPNGKGIMVEEETVTDTPKGAVTNKVVRKWTMSADGELTIDMYFDGPNGSYENKRIFKKS